MSWDPRTTYDVSEKEMGLMKKRAEMRAQLKAYWIKEFNNPHTRVRFRLQIFTFSAACLLRCVCEMICGDQLSVDLWLAVTCHCSAYNQQFDFFLSTRFDLYFVVRWRQPTAA